MTRFERRQVWVAAVAACLGCVCVALVVHYIRLEMSAFDHSPPRDYTNRIELAMLGAFLGFAVPFAVALTLRARLTPAVRLALALPLPAATMGLMALIPLAFLWLVSQMPL